MEPSLSHVLRCGTSLASSYTRLQRDHLTTHRPPLLRKFAPDRNRLRNVYELALCAPKTRSPYRVDTKSRKGRLIDGYSQCSWSTRGTSPQVWISKPGARRRYAA